MVTFKVTLLSTANYTRGYTMSQLNITSAAKAAGISRNTLYKKIKKGVISVTQDRQGNRVIDTGELIRVFGELERVTGGDAHTIRNHEHKVTVKSDAVNRGDNAGLQADIIQALRDQLDMVKRELTDSKDREKRLLGLLETKLLTDQQPVKLKANKKSKRGKKK
jgi:hypothetical protein